VEEAISAELKENRKRFLQMQADRKTAILNWRKG